MTHYTQLSMKERCQLNLLHDMGVGIREIANRMGRHPSTLYRELKRNQETGGYSPAKADKKALARKERPCNIERFPTLRAYVQDRLKLGWSPEQIAGRLKRKKSKYAICHETIYRYIYKKPNKDLYQYLAYKKPKRRRVHARKKQACRYGNRRIITERPDNIEQRTHAGHWEGDCIEFQGAKKTPVTTLLERKSRMLMLIKNESKVSIEVMTKISEKFTDYSPDICTTITFDQGGEFANFGVLETCLQCSVYYCHAHSPWEKGSNENMNGRLRWCLPSSSDIHNITQEELDQIADRMNNTPRKCLSYRTPKELFLKEFNVTCRTWV